jgi:asparagine synthase (glutamine-hydrolysing)
MCGIAGIHTRGGGRASGELADRMAAAVGHRGPDATGSYADGPVAFGHRRLAILDLSDAGEQPMVTADGRFAITYNGEVYNFRELRDELIRRGHRFRSTSDTEVVLHALAEWGLGALERFNGMFALALWDATERELWLARDRYGIKPLYWTTSGDDLMFASEVKGLLEHPSVTARVDRQALIEYFTFQNLLGEKTLFEGVRLLPAGTVLRREADGRLDTHSYWDFDFAEERNGDQREQVEELDRLFRQAVRRQLVSDVPVASYLSGGMDSGSITALAADELQHMLTFTVGFDLRSASGMELSFDERAKAEHMSYLFQTEHYEMVLKAGDLERAMPSLVWHLEEPRVGQSYPNFYAARLASRFGKVVLSGAGGDELFGGYPWRYYRAAVNDGFEQYIDKYFAYWQRLLPADGLEAVFRPIWNDVRDVSTKDVFRSVFSHHADRLTRPEDYINHSLYFEVKTFLHGLLVVEDKLSMASGLETRLPFLDNDLVEFAQRLPVSLKLANLGEVVRLNENEPGPKTQQFFGRTRDGKLILRRLMERYVPPDVARAEKQGFSAPDASWFRGESLDYVGRRVLAPDALMYQYLDRETIQSMVSEHLSGRQNRRLLLWSLLYFEEWCRAFLAPEAPRSTI